MRRGNARLLTTYGVPVWVPQISLKEPRFLHRLIVQASQHPFQISECFLQYRMVISESASEFERPMGA
jgi:hypothetical protein